jgi:hypothetical protein
MSTSPNAFSRARIAITADNRTVEIDEDCPPGSFTSEHIDFDLDGRVCVDHPDLKLEFRYEPRFAPMDFSPVKVMGGLVPNEPMQHHEQTVTLTADITMHGADVSFTGLGFRDRSWGFRDEARQWQEYLTVWGTFDDFDLSALTFMETSGRVIVDGFVNSAEGQRRVTETHFTYDPSGMLKTLRLVLDGTDERLVHMTHRLGGYWLPMGPQRGEGDPVLHSYDEFTELDAWGSTGRGILAYGIQRNLK